MILFWIILRILFGHVDFGHDLVLDYLMDKFGHLDFGRDLVLLSYLLLDISFDSWRQKVALPRNKPPGDRTKKV